MVTLVVGAGLAFVPAIAEVFEERFSDADLDVRASVVLEVLGPVLATLVLLAAGLLALRKPASTIAAGFVALGGVGLLLGGIVAFAAGSQHDFFAPGSEDAFDLLVRDVLPALTAGVIAVMAAVVARQGRSPAVLAVLGLLLMVGFGLANGLVEIGRADGRFFDDLDTAGKLVTVLAGVGLESVLPLAGAGLLATLTGSPVALRIVIVLTAAALALLTLVGFVARLNGEFVPGPAPLNPTFVASEIAAAVLVLAVLAAGLALLRLPQPSDRQIG